MRWGAFPKRSLATYPRWCAGQKLICRFNILRRGDHESTPDKLQMADQWRLPPFLGKLVGLVLDTHKTRKTRAATKTTALYN